ncbi:hypothetical protein T10_11740 [Trichinella papuae]|uniref:GRIP domain-containing protein n=1 Tax=Trichinella papuae TaxID=268474 RepID=A0A0V1MPY1_9BILA|nr:hypothetical protein T10_11740 [Trichinella papuae]KRZ73881.1 hypothetical protein T10_11740 [Trichinella papuae]KRZ73882.1 hypothetical protein T10_11740 [Trichinella papuae]
MSKDCQLSMSNSFPGSQLSAGSGSANRGQMPRKGILKQSASANQLQTGDAVEKDRSRSVSPKLVDTDAKPDEKKQYNNDLPQPAVRQSKKSKIPKLSVTWWETSAPYPEDPDEQELPGRETATNTSSPIIIMADDDDQQEEQLDRATEQQQQQELTTENRNEIAGLKPSLNEQASNTGLLDGRSSCCSSSYGSAVSQWWQGRSTRYVLHCEKRGCNHAHHGTDEEYMTPTQRKNREITMLKQQIRHLEWKLEDKESHLGQLRERLSELEAIMDRGGLLSENHRLLNKLNRIREEHQQEKKALCERFEQELTKVCNFYDKERADLQDTYQFEMDELRSTMVDNDDDMQDRGGEKPTKSTMQNCCETSNAEKGKAKLKIASFLDSAWDSGISHSVSRVDSATMTEEESIDQQQQQQSLFDELQAYHSECIFLHNCVVELQQQLRQREQSATAPSSTTPSGLETSNSEDCCAPTTTSNSGYTAIDAQIQAYKTECMIWRMKASELEIALKEQTPSRCRLEDRNAALQAENDDLRRALDAIKVEVRLMQTAASESTSKQVQLQKAEEDQTKEVKPATTTTTTTPLAQVENAQTTTTLEAERHLKAKDAVEDRLQKVVQEKHQLETELALLRMQQEDQQKEVADMEEKLKLKDELTSILEKQLMNKQGEYETVQLTLMNVRENGDRLTAKATRLEQRVVELEAILEQCGVIVRSGSSSRSNESKLPLDCSLARCRETQTDRSFFEQEKALAELVGLNEQYERLKHQHAEQSRTAQQQLADLADTLKAKNGLVNNLTSQMQTLCEELEALRQGFERERQSYRQQLVEQATALERVPLLERELYLAREELRRADEQADADRDRLHRAIEDSLTENLKIQNDTVAYWKQKLHNAQSEADAYKRQLEKKQTELQDLSVRLNLEKAGLAQQVNLSLSEVAEFQKRFNVPTADQKVMVRPVQVDREIDTSKRTSDGAVQVDRLQFCLDASTTIDKQQLLLVDDEKEQQLRLLRGELTATRAQVEVLQTKLITAEQRRQGADDLREQYKKAQEQIEDLQQELSVSKAEQKISEQNFQSKSQAWELERAKLVRDENERFLQLEKEFEKVREELKLMIDKHELEKADLLAKLHKEAAWGSQDRDGLQSPTAGARQTTTAISPRSPSTVPPEPEPQPQPEPELNSAPGAQLDLFNWLRDVISGEAADSTMLTYQQPPPVVMHRLNECLKENEQLKEQLHAQARLLTNITAELALYKAEESETVRRLEPQSCKHLSCFDLNNLDESERCVQQRQSVAWRRMLSQTCRQLIQLEQKLNKLETDRARIRYELDTLKGEYEMVTLSKDPQQQQQHQQQQQQQQYKATSSSKERQDQQLKPSTVSQKLTRKAETTTREYKPSASFQRWPTNTDDIRVREESYWSTSDSKQQQQQQSAARVGELQHQAEQYYNPCVTIEQPPKQLTKPTDQLSTILSTEAIQLQTAELKGRDDDQTDDNWKKQQLEPTESSAVQLSEQHQPQIYRVDYLTREETSSPIPHGSQERQQQQQEQAQLSKQQSSSPSTFSSRFRQSLSISERSSSTKFESSSSAKFTSANRSPTPMRISNMIADADRSTGGQSKLSRHESLEAVTTTACSETETDLMTQSFTISQESELFTRLGENQAPAESLPFFSCNNLITLCNNDVEELRQLLDLERQRFKWVEEKAAQLEKETSMLNYELNMLYQRQQRERKLLKEDNERLREQLNSMVNRLQAAASTSAKDPRCTCDRQRQTTRPSKTRSSSTSAMRDPSLEVSRRSRHNSSQDAGDLQQQCSSSRRHHHHHHHYHCSKQRSSTVVTEQEAALRFLRDSFYFYLIDREANDHLTAIMNILNFTNEQRARVLDRRGVSKL